MALGDRVVSDGLEFEVIWDGGEGLIGGRETRPSPALPPPDAPKRKYNKTGKHVGEFNRWHKPKPKCVVKMAKFEAGETCLLKTIGCVVNHKVDNIRRVLDHLEQEKTTKDEPLVVLSEDLNAENING